MISRVCAYTSTTAHNFRHSPPTKTDIRKVSTKRAHCDYPSEPPADCVCHVADFSRYEYEPGIFSKSSSRVKSQESLPVGSICFLWGLWLALSHVPGPNRQDLRRMSGMLASSPGSHAVVMPTDVCYVPYRNEIHADPTTQLPNRGREEKF